MLKVAEATYILIHHQNWKHIELQFCVNKLKTLITVLYLTKKIGTKFAVSDNGH